MGLRAALPVKGTTSNVVLHREGGIPPAEVILEGNCLRLSARLKNLDDRYHIRICASGCSNFRIRKYKKTAKFLARPEIQMSRLQRAYGELPEAEAPESLIPMVERRKSGSKPMEREDCVR